MAVHAWWRGVHEWSTREHMSLETQHAHNATAPRHKGPVSGLRVLDAGNMIAITVGLLTTVILGGLHIDAANLVMSTVGSERRFASSLPQVAFTWFAMIGALVVLVVGLFFRTPEDVLDAADRIRATAEREGDKPLATRAE